MQTVSLLNLYDQKLYSYKQYEEALGKICSEYPELVAYAEEFTLLTYGDHPTFIYLRKMLAQNQLPLQLVSRLGPFHIWLNLATDAGIYFNHVYSCIKNRVYGGSFSSKPTLQEVNHLNQLILATWIPIRKAVLNRFQYSKDVEYQSMFFLMEEVIPLAVLAYSTVFRSGMMQEWEEVLQRANLFFIGWHLCRYDKATLCTLTENKFLKAEFPEFYNEFSTFHNYFTEYKLQQTVQHDNCASSCSRHGWFQLIQYSVQPKNTQPSIHSGKGEVYGGDGGSVWQCVQPILEDPK